MAIAFATPAWSKAKEGKKTPAAKTAVSAAAKGAAKNAAPIKPVSAGLTLELSQLQQAVQAESKQIEAQQKQIAALQQMVAAMNSRGAASPAQVSPNPASNSASSATAALSNSTAVASASAVSPSSVAEAPAPAVAPARTVAVAANAASSSSSSNAVQRIGRKFPSAIELAGGKIKLGFTMYGDWGTYFHTGFGPQFVTQVNPPGPGNDNYNSFDITRTYINFFYSPNDKYTMRITPNLFRDVNNAPAQKIGTSGAASASSNGSLVVRIKYAYIDFNKLFASSPNFGDDKLTIGQQTNPLIDWEEAFYGYRFTSLVPWNYLSLSSTHAGVKLHGPVRFNGKQYLDYEVGVFDSGSFHNYELASEKQVMARLSYYPASFTGRFDGFGLTGFVDFGYANSTPDVPNHSLYRTAVLVHYANKNLGIAGEYDYGKNAFGVGNLFSATGPADAFGLGPTPYAWLATEAKTVLALGAQQRGFDFFGHVNIPHSRFSLFGLYQYFQPNTNVSQDPLDFARLVAGVGYKFDSHLDFALDSQNLLYTHSQFTFDGIPNAVPKNINALFLNVQVNY
jgi:hypothetical protein